MKKKLLLLLLFAIPFVASAQKRLVGITLDKGYGKEQARLNYDEQGRVTTYTISDEYRTEMDSYAIQYGANTIEVAEKPDKNGWADTYTYTLNNGRIESAYLFLDGDYVDINVTYEYGADNRLVKVVEKSQERGYPDIHTTTSNLTWNGNNLSSLINLYSAKDSSEGEEDEKSLFTYGSLKSEPIVHALFGFGLGYGANLHRFVEIIPTFPYLGKMPENLYSHVMYTDVEGKGTSDYEYSYETNGAGDIIKVTIFSSSKTEKVYTLEWEGTAQEDPQEKDLTDEGNKTVKYKNGGFTDDTNLNGNVIDNIYYNISPDNGGFDAFEGYIYINEPTADSDVDVKDPFGEDARKGFTGIAFKVAAGSGKIKVNAETTGSMMMKVRVGHNEPYEMMLVGKTMATFPYNVSEPTFVFIYGSLFTGARGVSQSPASDSLKIYGLSWESGADGIETMQMSDVQNAAFYNLNGQRVSSPQKGRIYIQNGKKIIQK